MSLSDYMIHVRREGAVLDVRAFEVNAGTDERRARSLYNFLLERFPPEEEWTVYVIRVTYTTTSWAPGDSTEARRAFPTRTLADLGVQPRSVEDQRREQAAERAAHRVARIASHLSVEGTQLTETQRDVLARLLMSDR